MRFVCANGKSELVALVIVVAAVQLDSRFVLVESDTVPEFVVNVASEPRLPWPTTSDGGLAGGNESERDGMLVCDELLPFRW